MWQTLSNRPALLSTATTELSDWNKCVITRESDCYQMLSDPNNCYQKFAAK
jgi:hypothetical protein